MKNYVVTALIEVEAASLAEAEEMVMDLVVLDVDDKVVDTYVEIKEVKEV